MREFLTGLAFVAGLALTAYVLGGLIGVFIQGIYAVTSL